MVRCSRRQGQHLHSLRLVPQLDCLVHRCRYAFAVHASGPPSCGTVVLSCIRLALLPSLRTGQWPDQQKGIDGVHQLTSRINVRVQSPFSQSLTRFSCDSSLCSVNDRSATLAPPTTARAASSRSSSTSARSPRLDLVPYPCCLCSLDCAAWLFFLQSRYHALTLCCCISMTRAEARSRLQRLPGGHLPDQGWYSFVRA